MASQSRNAPEFQVNFRQAWPLANGQSLLVLGRHLQTSTQMTRYVRLLQRGQPPQTAMQNAAKSVELEYRWVVAIGHIHLGEIGFLPGAHKPFVTKGVPGRPMAPTLQEAVEMLARYRGVPLPSQGLSPQPSKPKPPNHLL